jgi:hypothetical protein
MKLFCKWGFSGAGRWIGFGADAMHKRMSWRKVIDAARNIIVESWMPRRWVFPVTTRYQRQEEAKKKKAA